MTVAQSSESSLRMSEETVFGVPLTGAYTEIPHLTETLESGMTRVQSSELRPDRKLMASRLSKIGASGGISGQLRADGANEDLIHAALQATGSVWGGAVGPISGAGVTIASSSTIADSLSGFTPPLAGDFVLLSGWDAAANNRIVKVSTATAALITTRNTDLVPETPGTATKFVIEGTNIASAGNQRSFSIERAHADLSTEFALFRGMVVKSMAVGASEDFVSLAFEFMGKDEESPRPDVVKGSSIVPMSTHPPYAGPNDIGMFIDNLDVDITTFSVNVENNLHGAYHATKKGNQSIGAGQSTISGGFQALFEDSTEIDKFLADSQTSLAFRCSYGAYGYVFELPASHLKKAANPRSSAGAPITVDYEFDAVMETASPNDVIRVWRFTAP